MLARKIILRRFKNISYINTVLTFEFESLKYIYIHTCIYVYIYVSMCKYVGSCNFIEASE